MGTLVRGPFGQGLLTGRVRRGQENPLRRVRFSKHLTDERRIDVVEQLIPLAAEAGMPIAPPGTDVSALNQDYVPPALQDSDLRRRPLRRRSAA